MPVSFEFRERALVMRLVGHYALDEWLGVLDDAINQPGRPDIVGLVIDLTRSESVAARDNADVRKIVRFLGERGAPLRHRVVVVAPEDLSFGISRMGEALLDPYGVVVGTFRTADESWAWLLSSDSARDQASER